MEYSQNQTIIATYGAVIATLGTIIALVDDELIIDGHSYRQVPSRRFSMRQSLFAIADLNTAFEYGWFCTTFRCNKPSFETICQSIKSKWNLIHDPIGHNAIFSIRDRVAMILFYLTHPGSLSEAAQVFGMSKSSAIRFIKEITDILVDCILNEIIYLPSQNNILEWDNLSKGFENICGFPNCCLAIDGTLFQIERPKDFFGWYCRKSYPAINAQLVVDYNTRIRSYDLRPGSANDKSIFNYSGLETTLSCILPNGRYIIADAGYTLSKQVIIPYSTEDTDPSHIWFNYLHSRIRITVECTIGILKNRFRILKLPLNQKENTITGRSATSQMARIIESCLVLHNLLIDLNDDIIISESIIQEEINENNKCIIDNDFITIDIIFQRNCIANYLYENQSSLKEMYK